MVTLITEGIKISVETHFQPEYSNPAYDHYMFSYRITIENLTGNTIQLLSRHWKIFDSNGAKREVEGEGVVGVQPVIEPGACYEYISGCNLKSDMGFMRGSYTMKRTLNDSLFAVEIPKFLLETPFRLN